MKKIILSVITALSITASAQNNTVSDILEGSKTLVDLVRVFKTPKYSMLQSASLQRTDSCAVRGVTDFCVKNSTAKPLTVSLYRRNGNIYETSALTMLVLPKNKEWLYEIKSGVYKMKIETEEDDVKKIFREGEVKINSCENPVKEIKEK